MSIAATILLILGEIDTTSAVKLLGAAPVLIGIIVFDIVDGKGRLRR